MKFGEFIRAHRDRVVHEWASGVRDMSRARDLDGGALLNHVPDIVADIGAICDGEEPATAQMTGDAEAHAAERVEQGFTLTQILREFSMLRACILRLWSTEHPALTVPDVTAFLSAFDVAVERAVERYFQMRSRLTQAYERISTAAVESSDLDTFLQNLLEVFKETAPSVDTLQILLRDGDRLRARASIGLEEEVRTHFSLRIGEGFAGTVAATGEPMMLEDASHHPLIVSSTLRARGTKALYGVPLVDRGYVVGVAHVGSMTAEQIPEPERRLFRAVAQRATSAILKQSFRYSAARRAAELEAVIQSIPDAVFIATADKIVLANGPELAQLGVDSIEALENVPVRTWFERLDVRDARTGRPVAFEEYAYARALRGERVTSEITVKEPPTGRERHLRVTVAPVVVASRIVAVVGVSTDITERVSIEKEREDFLNAVVHDIRNPLTAIAGSAMLAARRLEGRGDHDLAAVAHRIQRNVVSLNLLLTDLLDVTLASAGRLAIDPERVRVDVLVTEVAGEWSATSHVHTLEAGSLAPLEVIADPERVRQVLTNLISNAIKYSPHGGKVRLSVTRKGRVACVAVSDEGIGIREDHKARIFERYARTKTASGVRGQGLGLFVVQEIVRAHGGELGVESELGKGSTFWFTLPLADDSEPTVRLRK